MGSWGGEERGLSRLEAPDQKYYREKDKTVNSPSL
jgi:hypothetical protein